MGILLCFYIIGGRNMVVAIIIRDKKNIQSGHKTLFLSRKFEKQYYFCPETKWIAMTIQVEIW